MYHGWMRLLRVKGCSGIPLSFYLIVTVLTKRVIFALSKHLSMKVMENFRVLLSNL